MESDAFVVYVEDTLRWVNEIAKISFFFAPVSFKNKKPVTVKGEETDICIHQCARSVNDIMSIMNSIATRFIGPPTK